MPETPSTCSCALILAKCLSSGRPERIVSGQGLGLEAEACGYEWKPITRGDVIPHGAVSTGQTAQDGDVFVAMNSRMECGKLNTDSGRVWNIWSHEDGQCGSGFLLVARPGAFHAFWKPIKRGDDLPAGALCAGVGRDGGQAFVARYKAECGKLVLMSGRVSGIHCHTYGRQECGEILLLSKFADPSVDMSLDTFLGLQVTTPNGSLVGFEWKDVCLGDPIPAYAIKVGTTWFEGEVYVGINEAGVCGKLLSRGGAMRGVLCHGSGSRATRGKILLRQPGNSMMSWRAVKRGDALPEGAVRSSPDADTYVARSGSNCGEVNVKDGKVCEFKSHGLWPWADIEVLVFFRSMLAATSPRWIDIRKGDPLPQDAVLAGETKTDGVVYVALNSLGECGKLNTDKGNMWHIWCHGNRSGDKRGRILTVSRDHHYVSWQKVQSGDEIPSGAFRVGEMDGGARVFVGRHRGECGAILARDGKVGELLCHSQGSSKVAEILVLTYLEPPSPISDYEWQQIKEGDAVPGCAVQVGRTSGDGDVYAAQNDAGAIGKLSVDEVGRVREIWCPDVGLAKKGRILVNNRLIEKWVCVKKGDSMPRGAVSSNTDRIELDIPKAYVGRFHGECGQVVVQEDRMVEIRCHYLGNHSKAEVLVFEPQDQGHPPAEVTNASLVPFSMASGLEAPLMPDPFNDFPLNWLPRSDWVIDPGVRSLIRSTRRGDFVPLTCVSGPAILWAWVCLVLVWTFFIVFPWIVYYSMDDCAEVRLPNPSGIVWIVFGVMILTAVLIEWKCSSYVLPLQLHVCGQFNLLGQEMTQYNFWVWRLATTILSCTSHISIGGNGILLARAWKMDECLGEGFLEVWRRVLGESCVPFLAGISFSTFVGLMWGLMLLQAGFPLLTSLPLGPPVNKPEDLGLFATIARICRSLPSINKVRVDYVVPEDLSSKQCVFEYYTVCDPHHNHGSALYCIALASRMASIGLQDLSYARKKMQICLERLKAMEMHELQDQGREEAFRYLHLAKDPLSRCLASLFYVCLLECAFQLNLQISLLGILKNIGFKFDFLDLLPIFSNLAVFFTKLVSSRQVFLHIFHVEATVASEGILWEGVSEKGKAQFQYQEILQTHLALSIVVLLYSLAMFYALLKTLALYLCSSSMMNLNGCA